jgi:uncharacterized protein (DUF433 family)
MIAGSLADAMTSVKICEAYPHLTDQDIHAALACAADVLHQDVMMPIVA